MLKCNILMLLIQNIFLFFLLLILQKNIKPLDGEGIYTEDFFSKYSGRILFFLGIKIMGILFQLMCHCYNLVILFVFFLKVRGLPKEKLVLLEVVQDI